MADVGIVISIQWISNQCFDGKSGLITDRLITDYSARGFANTKKAEHEHKGEHERRSALTVITYCDW